MLSLYYGDVSMKSYNKLTSCLYPTAMFLHKRWKLHQLRWCLSRGAQSTWWSTCYKARHIDTCTLYLWREWAVLFGHPMPEGLKEEEEEEKELTNWQKQFFVWIARSKFQWKCIIRLGVIQSFSNNPLVVKLVFKSTFNQTKYTSLIMKLFCWGALFWNPLVNLKLSLWLMPSWTVFIIFRS